MRVTVLGSGSRGNAILVESGEEALLIDAGFSFKEILRRCGQAGRDASRIRAIALTHEHGDHSRGVARAAKEWSVPVAGSAGTLDALRPTFTTPIDTIALPPARGTAVGSWRITAFPSAHDARDPVVLIAEDPAGRRIGVACDVGSPTTALRHAIRGLDALVIESNHDEVMLRGSAYPPSVRARIAGRAGHLSNVEASRLVAEAAHSRLGLVVLAHLSERCNETALALDTMKAALRGTAFSGRVIVAAQDAPTETVELAQTLAQLALPL
jgi:phosphoribosyl 1,2-cyclic phosphodiesterase